MKYHITYLEAMDLLNRVGATSHVYNMRVTTLINLGSKLRKFSGRDINSIANGLKTMFIRLNRPEMINFLKNNKINPYNQRGHIRSFNAILNEVKKLNYTQQNEFAEKIGGVFQINLVKILITY
jgi:TP901 family phage tail tape measure protein